jgi:ABC-type xylose transport system permease subunit
MGLQFEWQYIITGLVLLAAIVIDAVSRRGSGSGSATRV